MNVFCMAFKKRNFGFVKKKPVLLVKKKLRTVVKQKVAGAVYSGSKYWHKNNTTRVELIALRKRLRDAENSLGAEAPIFRESGLFEPANEMEKKLVSASLDYKQALDLRKKFRRDNKKFPVSLERNLQAKVIKWARKNKGVSPKLFRQNAKK